MSSGIKQMLDMTQLKQKLDEDLEQFFDDKLRAAAKVSPHYVMLWRAIKQSVLAGGKRIRPYMVMTAFDAYADDSQDPTSAHTAALAIELLHSAMLVHDDIIDKDLVRHGIDNISGSYMKLYQSSVEEEARREHYANSAALIAGDLLLSAAHTLLMLHLDEPAATRKEIAALFDESIFRVCGGELLDTEGSFLLDRSDALVIAREKTAGYSFEVPLAIGATLAGAPAQQIEILAREYGRSLGIAYQLQDDILGTFGDEELLGKSTVGDLREGKRTFLVERLYAMASRSEIAEFERAFGVIEATDEAIQAAKSALVSSGALAATEHEIGQLLAVVHGAVDKLQVDKVHKEALLRLMQTSIRRQA